MVPHSVNAFPLSWTEAVLTYGTQAQDAWSSRYCGNSVVSVTTWKGSQFLHQFGTKAVPYQHFGSEEAVSARLNDVVDGHKSFITEKSLKRFSIIAKVKREPSAYISSAPARLSLKSCTSSLM